MPLQHLDCDDLTVTKTNFSDSELPSPDEKSSRIFNHIFLKLEKQITATKSDINWKRHSGINLFDIRKTHQNAS